MTKVCFELKDYSDARWGKGWARKVESVDPNSTNGYGIDGEFLQLNATYEMEVGSIILCMFPRGSNKYHAKGAYIFVVTENGLEEQDESYVWNKNYIGVRDHLIRLLEETAPQKKAVEQARLDLLKDYSIEELMEEIKRRQGVDSE